MALVKQLTSEWRQAADIFGNVSVAWFSAGVIIPLFGQSINQEFLLRLLWASLMTGVFFLVSLKLAKKGKK